MPDTEFPVIFAFGKGGRIEVDVSADKLFVVIRFVMPDVATMTVELPNHDIGMFLRAVHLAGREIGPSMEGV